MQADPKGEYSSAVRANYALVSGSNSFKKILEFEGELKGEFMKFFIDNSVLPQAPVRAKFI